MFSVVVESVFFWEPKQTGLIKHTSKKDGTTAWISSEGIKTFDEFGIDAFGS